MYSWSSGKFLSMWKDVGGLKATGFYHVIVILLLDFHLRKNRQAFLSLQVPVDEMTES